MEQGLDIDNNMHQQQLKKNLSVRQANSRIKFNFTSNSLSCFISQMPRSSSTQKRGQKNAIYSKPLIQVLQEFSTTRSYNTRYFDKSFDHKLLLTTYGQREMYVDEEPKSLTTECRSSYPDEEDPSNSEVVSQVMSVLSEETADQSITHSIPQSYHMAYQHSINDSGKYRSRTNTEQPLFSIRPFESEDDGRTTLMLRNIPNKYTQQMVLQEVEAAGLNEKYDFFYLPIDFKNDCNVGYAFINVIDVRFVSNIYEKFHGKKWPRFNSQKICQVCYARIQGTPQLMNHFRFSNTLQRDNRSRPLIFLNLALSQNKTNKETTRVNKQYASSTI